MNAALSPESDPMKAGHLALRLIETADPPVQAEISLSGKIPQTPEEIQRAFDDGSLLELIRSGALTPPAP
jgi:hypothetical protein